MGPQVQKLSPVDILERWKTLSFAFDPDTMDPPNPPHQLPQDSKSRDEITDAALLAQLAELARLSHQDSNVGYARASQSMQNPQYPSPHYPQLHNVPHHAPPASQHQLHELWSQLAALGHQYPHPHTPLHTPGPAFHPFDQQQLQQPPHVPGLSFASSSTSPAQVSTTVTSGPNSPTGTDAEGLNTLEDKRKRNTEASARFRIKKKQKALNLQRSVTDLTGRAEELEKEAAELRRENGWLKEIIMLKSNRLTDLANTVDAYQLAGNSSSHTTKQDKTIEEDPKEDETGDDSDYEESSSKGKGKGKQKAKPDTKRRKR